MSRTRANNMRGERPIPGLAGRCRHCGQDVRVLHSRGEGRGVQWVAIDAVEIVAYVFGEGPQAGGMPRLVRALHRCAVEDESVAGLILTLLGVRGQMTSREMVH